MTTSRRSCEKKKDDKELEALIGDNSGAVSEELLAFVERVERLNEERQALADDVKDVFAEVKGRGFDVKAVREIIRIRKQDSAEYREHQEIIDTYLRALGML